MGLTFCVCARGLSKIGEVKGEGVKSGYRTKGLITHEPGRLALQRSRHLSKRNKNQFCDYMTTEPARLAGIPGSRVEIFQEITLAGCYSMLYARDWPEFLVFGARHLVTRVY